MNKIFTLITLCLFVFNLSTNAQSKAKKQVRDLSYTFSQKLKAGEFEEAVDYTTVEFQDGDDNFLKNHQKQIEIIFNGLGNFEVQDLFRFRDSKKIPQKLLDSLFIAAFRVDKNAVVRLGYPDNASIFLGPLIGTVIGPLPATPTDFPDNLVGPVIFRKMNQIAKTAQDKGQNLLLIPILRTQDGPKIYLTEGVWTDMRPLNSKN